MFRDLLLGIGIGGVIFTQIGKKIVNDKVNDIKNYVMKGISNTDVAKVGKEFLSGYNSKENKKPDEEVKPKEISKKY